MAANLYGLRICVGTSTDGTWANTTLYDKFNFYVPVSTGSITNVTRYLYRNYIFVPETAQDLDTWCPNWQMATPFITKGSGTMSTDYYTAQILGTFPEAIDIRDLSAQNQYIILWDENNQTHYVRITTSGGSVSGTSIHKRSDDSISASIRMYSTVIGSARDGCTIQVAVYNPNTNSVTVYGKFGSLAQTELGNTILDDVWNINPLFQYAFTSATTNFQPKADDPYEPGGTSGPGGGGGTFDLQSDVIGLPPLPTLSFAATGFTRIYNPTLSELNSLANYLWTDQTFLDTVINHLKQLLENPMDAIISLALLPCPIPNGSPESVKVMYINTGVTMAPATTQFVDVDCGTYTIEEFYGSALDYNPYTKVHCYLPYIGQVTLDTDEVMGRTLHVMYRIDIVTGMCAAMILVDQNVLYQFSGHCSINMPINSADFSGYIGAAMTAGKMVAGVVAGASGNLPLAAELIGAPAPHSSSSETVEKTTVRNPKTGRQVTSGTSTKATTRNTPGASFGEMSRKAVANTVGAVMGSKLTVEHAGGFTGNSGYLAIRRPYLIIERPRMCNPEEYGRYNGRPSMIYMSLSECSGYTEVQSIQFEGISATNPELSELSELLKSGVIF